MVLRLVVVYAVEGGLREVLQDLGLVADGPRPQDDVVARQFVAGAGGGLTPELLPPWTGPPSYARVLGMHTA